MKRGTILTGCLMALALFFMGCSQVDDSLGKSLGRWDGFNLESMIQNRAGGLDFIEVTMNDVIGKDTAGVRERVLTLKDQIDSSGLKVWSVHMPYSKTIDISLLDSAKRADALKYVKDMMRVSSVFKPQRIILHPSHEPVSPDEREERLAISSASIGELAPIAKAMGAVLCVENLPRTCLGKNGQEMVALIEGYDDVCLCFDVNHLLYQSHEEFLGVIPKNRIQAVHISDYDFADERHLLPGVGKIEWAPLWKAIRAKGYDGPMIFECYGDPSELAAARDILTGKVVPEKSNVDVDSLAFRNAAWQITELVRGAQAMYAQVPMFFSTQSISAVKYPASEFKTEILHRPGELSGTPSGWGKKVGATAAVNAGYFHVIPCIPSVYFRIGEEVYGRTHPTEVYRVNGVVGFKDQDGKQMCIEYSDTTQYQSVSADWHSVMASGPMLMKGGEIVVPLLTGDSADGDNVAAMSHEQMVGVKITTHYSSVLFYDKRHPRTAVGTDNEGNIYYVVIDGRFPGQGDGASIYETAYICKMLGMTDAINLDGGGSSALWSDVTGVLNHPRDNRKFDHEGERAVPNLIVAY